MVRIFSAFAGLLAASAALALFALLAVSRNADTLGWLGALAALLCISLIAGFVFSLVRLLAMAYAGRLAGAHVVVSWRAPRQRTSLAFWMAYGWDFHDRNGRHLGGRLLGLEVILVGGHHAW